MNIKDIIARYAYETKSNILTLKPVPKSSLIPGHEYSGMYKNPCRMIWNGEMFDYIGSDNESRQIYHYEDSDDGFIPMLQND